MEQFCTLTAIATYGRNNLRVFGEGVSTMTVFPYCNIPVQCVEYVMRISKGTELILTPLNRKANTSCGDGILNELSHHLSDFDRLVNDHTYRVYVLTADGYRMISPNLTMIQDIYEKGLIYKLKYRFKRYFKLNL